MDTHKPLIIIFFFIVFFLFAKASSFELCSNTLCKQGEPAIRFPFHLKNALPSCTYPGFNLFCDAFHQTLVELPFSGKFAVQAIDYQAQSLWLNDPDNCMPKRLLDLNLSGSPFTGVFYQNFTFFNCSFDYTRYKFDPIGCLSGENYTVFASSSEMAFRFLSRRCGLINIVSVPVQRDFFEPVMTSDLSDSIRLKWTEPRCGRCESRGGVCGLKSNSSRVTECRYATRHGLPRGARYAIVVVAGVPCILCLMGLFCHLCRKVKHYSTRNRHRITEFSSIVVPHTSTTTSISGLDATTIESYPKTTLGESLRLPKPDDNICSICLAEYRPKETLRSIPECQHCFHAECIDEWLRQRASCPVCRMSPKSSPRGDQGSEPRVV